jgi:hypothetical protein
LECWKEKAFGAHTDVEDYTFDPEPFVGQTLNFCIDIAAIERAVGVLTRPPKSPNPREPWPNDR